MLNFCIPLPVDGTFRNSRIAAFLFSFINLLMDTLNYEQTEQFVRDGFARIDKAFSEKAAETVHRMTGHLVADSSLAGYVQRPVIC